MLSMKTVTDITDDEVLRQELEQLVGLDPEGVVPDEVIDGQSALHNRGLF